MDFQNTFVGQVLDGRGTPDEIDGFVETWHGNAYDEPTDLHEALGMSEAQYALWVRDPGALPKIISDVRAERSLLRCLVRGEDADPAAHAAAWSPASGVSLACHLGMTDAQHARYAADPASLPDIVRECRRAEALHAAHDILTAYMTDECPDDQDWEDFDPDVDDIRTQISDALG